MLKQTFWVENLIKYSPVIIILLLSFKERENMAPSCKFKSPVWEHFDFWVAILSLFYVCRWKNIQIYIMSTYFGCEMQTVYSCLNRTEITENRHQKLKPNRTEKNLNRGSPSDRAQICIKANKQIEQRLQLSFQTISRLAMMATTMNTLFQHTFWCSDIWWYILSLSYFITWNITWNNSKNIFPTIFMIPGLENKELRRLAPPGFSLNK